MKHKIRIISLFTIVAFLLTIMPTPLSTAAVSPLIVGHSEIVDLGGGTKMEVYVQMPKTSENYLATKKFPALVYLHDSVSALKISNLIQNPGSEDFWPGYINQSLEIPIFVIAPKFSGTKIDWTTKGAAVIKALLAMEAKYNIDSTRLFVGGNAAGGDGTFYVAQAGQSSSPAVSFTGLFATNPNLQPAEATLNSLYQKAIWIMQGKDNKNYDIGDLLVKRCLNKSSDVTYMQFNSKDKVEEMMLDENLISFMLSRPGSNIGKTVFFPVANPIAGPQSVSGTTSTGMYQLFYPNLLGVSNYTLTSSIKYPLVIELFGSGGMEGSGYNFLPSNTQNGFFKLLPREKNANLSLQSPQSMADMVDGLIAAYPIDPDKVTLMGYSLGGMNVFDHIKAFPDKYAGIVSSNGSANGFASPITDLFKCGMDKFCHVPVFLTHDFNDMNNPVRYEKANVTFSMLSQFGSNVVFMSQLLNGVHLPRVDNRGLGIYAWMLKQDRKNNIKKPIPAQYLLPVARMNNLTSYEYVISGTTNPYTKVQISGPGITVTPTVLLSDQKGIFSYKITPAQGQQYPALGSTYQAVVTGLNGVDGPAVVSTLVDGTPPYSPTVNKLKPLCKTLTGKTGENYDVFVLNGGKQIATKKADSKGNFSIPISAYKPGTKLTVYVINTNKIESDPVTITVATLATPKVSAVKQNAKALSGTAEAGTTAYVKYNSKVVASAKVSSKGKFTIKIKGYKKGVKLYVYVKNAYGYSSASKVVTVSK